MGKIIERIITLKPKIDFVLTKITEVDTSVLAREMHMEVYDIFRTVVPLAYKFHKVCDMDHYYYKELWIGHWLRRKGGYHKYGELIDRREDAFKVLRQFGDELKTEVRTPIIEDFSKLVELSHKLIDYDTLMIRQKLGYPIRTFGLARGYKKNPGMVTTEEVIPLEMFISTQRPVTLYLPKKKFTKIDEQAISYSRSISLNKEANISYLEDLLDDLVKLFKKAEAKVGKIRRHNLSCLRKMQDVIAPYKIAKALT